MKIRQQKFSKATGWEILNDDHFDPASCNFAMAFGSSSIPGDPDLYQTVRNMYPRADIIMYPTAGEIYDTQVNDDTLSLTAVYFEAAKIKTATVQINEVKNSFEVRSRYGDDTAITGFYSYGEISPSFKSIKCELYNQTMTILTLSE